LRDYLWFCLEHVREYNKSWNYYEGLQGAALEAEIRRATTWERPSWKFATGKPSENSFEDPLGLFDFDNREAGPAQRQITPEERQAWQILQLSPVTDIDIVKKQYKRLVKQTHPDKNGGDAAAEERLKDINLAYSLIRKSLVTSGGTAAH
jgi:DnaJ-domain-containing protein 1